MSADEQHTVQRPIEAQLRPAIDEEGVARVWRGLRERGVLDRASLAAQRRRRARVIASVGALAAAALALVALWPRTAEERGLASSSGVLEAGDAIAAGEAPVVLDDGSTLAVQHAAELEVLANDGERFVTLLRRGRCHFAVTPGGPRRWTIETDLATVEVVGTEFTVDRGEAGLVVTVDHGVVLVRGERVPGRVRQLRAGERLELPRREVALDAPAEDPSSSEASELEGDAPAEEEVVPAALEATDGEVGAASEEPPRVIEAATREPDLDALLARADEARAGGRPEEAARILAELERAHGGDPRGALAAFTLGRLELEVLGDPRAAAATFARVVARGRPRALIEDAQARRVEALVRAGEAAEALRAAAEFERRWPGGRRLDEVRALVRSDEAEAGE